MAYGSSTSSNPPPHTSSYRVKFKKSEFLNLIKIAQPEFLFHVKNMFFFGFQGFVVYSLDCDDKDLSDSHIQILEAIEFSNGSWAKR